MKILVIDDNEMNRTAAYQALGGVHDLTVVGTYDEAHKLLEVPYVSGDMIQAELARRGLRSPYDWTWDASKEERGAAGIEWKRLEKELCPPPPFDVVLCDLLMPASRMKMAPEAMKYVGQEMPVGFALSLMATLHGAKYVAVVTATNHHDHPASAMLDALKSCPESKKPPRFTINGARVGYYQGPMMYDDSDNAVGKDWGAVLKHLLVEG